MSMTTVVRQRDFVVDPYRIHVQFRDDRTVSVEIHDDEGKPVDAKGGAHQVVLLLGRVSEERISQIFPSDLILSPEKLAEIVQFCRTHPLGP